MAQITWRNVDAPDLSSSIEGMARISQAGTDAFTNIGKIFSDRYDQARKKATDEATARLLMADSTGDLTQQNAANAASNDWRLDKSALGAVYQNAQNNLLQREVNLQQRDRGAFDAEVRASEANYGGAITQALLDLETKGTPIPEHLRREKAFLDEASNVLNAQRGYRNSQERVEDQKYRAGRDVVQDQNAQTGFALQRASINQSATASERAFTAAQAPTIAANFGIETVDRLTKAGTLSLPALMRQISSQGAANKLTPAQILQAQMSGTAHFESLKQNTPYDSQRILDNSDLTSSANLQGQARIQEAVNYPLAGMGRFSQIHVLTPEEINIPDGDAVALYTGEDKAEATNLIRRYATGIPLPVAYSALNSLTGDIWSLGSIDDDDAKEMFTALREALKPGGTYLAKQVRLGDARAAAAGFVSQAENLVEAQNVAASAGRPGVSKTMQDNINALIAPARARRIEDQERQAATDAAKVEADRLKALALERARERAAMTKTR